MITKVKEFNLGDIVIFEDDSIYTLEKFLTRNTVRIKEEYRNKTFTKTMNVRELRKLIMFDKVKHYKIPRRNDFKD